MSATPASPNDEVDVFGLTHTGRVRESNEDHFVVASARMSVRIRSSSLDVADIGERLGGTEALLLAIADGVGGRAGGEVASSTAVETLLHYLGSASGCFRRFDVAEEAAFLAHMESAIRAAHETIVRNHGDVQTAPATTLTVAMLVAPRAYIIHVGDSRAYCLRGNRLSQITRDQTLGAYMVDVGAWTDTQAARIPAARALASAIGSADLTPAIGLIDLDPGDSLLLCSDGLTKHVSDARLAEVLGRAVSAEGACAELLSLALDEGGSDNITVVVARLGGAASS